MARTKFAFLFIVNLSAVAVFCHVEVTAAITYRTVALEGQPAPGTIGDTRFEAFGSILINNAGQTAFHAFLEGPEVTGVTDNGIWSEGGGTLDLVMRDGFAPPGVESGITIAFFESFLYNDAGHVAFQANLGGPGIDGTNRRGIWSEGPGNLELVARVGSQAPGFASGNNFDTTFQGVVLGDAGDIAFEGFLAGPGIDAKNNAAVWSGTSNHLEIIARKGSPAVGMDVGVNYAFFESTVINGAGQVAFSGTGVSGTSPNQVFTWGVWSEGGGSFHLVAREDMPAPGLGPDVSINSLGLVTINNAGQTTMWSILKGPGIDASNAIALWTETNGSLQLVARTGTQAPGLESGVGFWRFETPRLNGAGQTTFRATLVGSDVDESNDTSIWSEAGGNLHLIAREGSEAPGAGPGVTFADFADDFLFFTNRDPVINAAGNVAFWAKLSGPSVNSTNDIGIWAQGPNGLDLIAREGDLFEVAPGDLRIVGSLFFAGESGNEDGRPSNFNDWGQLAFTAYFLDGTSGVFVANLRVIPEPASIFLLLTAFVGIAARRIC